ncbi:hypothetical protein ILYODFUR_005603 [Ilyodon furcidens]|uniref:Tripartite motif-containing protein 65 n=1 Tax=Ilyodon furcidens TaxID=33524 RepID=A0ABV0UF20_9TELE
MPGAFQVPCNHPLRPHLLPVLKRNVSLSVLTEAANSPGPSCREPMVRSGEGTRTMLLCDRHKKPLVYYCRQDKMPVCCECGITECINHDRVMLEAERENQELLLERKSKEVEKHLEDTQKSIIDLQENINDTKESTQVEVPRFKDIPTGLSPNLQDRLNGVTDVLTRVSKLVSEDLEKAVCTAVVQDNDGSPQDKRPVLAVVPSPAAPCVPGGKEGLSAYRCSLTFDPRTANEHLCLSHENRRAEHLTSGPRPVPAHEARFDHTWQVLCFQGFKNGRHYWELEVSKPWAYLGVTYETIPRKEKGKRCMVGMNELSWSLQLDEHQLSAWHNGRRETLVGQSNQSRIGMLLDYEAGTLTYYGAGQTRLHAFHCAFTHELFPACWIGEGVSITLCST